MIGAWQQEEQQLCKQEQEQPWYSLGGSLPNEAVQAGAGAALAQPRREPPHRGCAARSRSSPSTASMVASRPQLQKHVTVRSNILFSVINLHIHKYIYMYKYIVCVHTEHAVFFFARRSSNKNCRWDTCCLHSTFHCSRNHFRIAQKLVTE